MSLLDIQNLSISFQSPDGRTTDAVKNVNFSIQPGEMLALVGESGSGKSLTALSVLQLLPQSAKISGSVKLEGQEIMGASSAALQQVRGGRVGMIFQEPLSALNPLHTIGQQVDEMLVLHQRGMTPVARKARVLELFDLVGLAHFKDRLDAWPHQLSGGERQRVMIAMAIANNPALLIADEPTTAVDVTIQAKILAKLKELQKQLSMSMLFITHDLGLVKRLADRVAVMKGGELVEIGTVADVFERPQHAYTKTLIGSAPKGGAVPLPANAQPLIATESLKVHFPIKRGILKRTVGYVKAVDGVSVTIPEGATLGVVGESGSGKSTLAFALLRLVRSEGKIVFLSKQTDVLKGKELLPLRRHMQLVFQDPFGSLNPRMTIRQIIEEGLLVHEKQLSEAERIQRVETILTEVGLKPEMSERYPHEFSGGQRQRISIARAMVLRPKLVVLDEPTSALDLTVQSQILALLKDLQSKYGMSYIFISHDLRVIRAIAHRILVMCKGKVVEEAETEALFARPKEDYTRTLIESSFFA